MKNKKVLITQSNYIPWKGYFDAINSVDEFIIYDDMQYTKRDWRNRNKIKTAKGLQWITVPVDVKGKFFQKINETKTSDNDWGEKHWNVILQNYSKTSAFNQYKDVFSELYLNNNKQLLSEINYEFIRLICNILGINTTIRWSSEFHLAEEKTERLVQICKQTQATDYYTGPAAKAYMDEELFEKENIKIHYLDYSGYTPYHQLFGDFTHEVSILDLLFNEGEGSRKYMKSFN